MNTSINNSEEESSWLQKEKEQLKGNTLSLALLSVIFNFQNKGGIYGYKLGEETSLITQGELHASNASFYSKLRRLEQEGLIESILKDSEEGPKRKHYFLTEKGFREFTELKYHWEYTFSLFKLIKDSEINYE